MRLAVDFSSFAKRYIQEAGSDELDDLLQHASELALCVVLVPELISGLNRRLREGALTDKDYRKAKRLLLEDVRDATVLQLTPAVISRSATLLEKIYCVLWMPYMSLALWSGRRIYSSPRTKGN
jgi:predicted nucleic acid-binding protein